MKYSNNNKPLVCMMTNSSCYKNTTEFKPKGVLWHSTGANNEDLCRYVQPSDNDPRRDELIKLLGKNRYNNDWNHVKVDAGLNCWIGELDDGTVTTVQTMPWNYKPWGCGGGPKGSCNNTHIQFEICEADLNNKTYFEKVYKEACELTAYLCDMFDLDPKGTINYNGVTVPVILCHADSCKLGLGSNHGDIYHWFNRYGKDMDDVRNDVAKLMNKTTPVVTPAAPTPVVDTTFKIGDEVKLVSGATYYNGVSIPGWVMNSKLYVREIDADDIIISTLKTGAITGRVNKKYLTKNGNVVSSTTNKNETVATKALAVGDEVRLVDGAKYHTGVSVPTWVINSKLYVRELQGDDVVISTLKTGAITGKVNKKYIKGQTSTSVATFASYKVQVTVDALNIRDGASTDYKINGTIRDRGVYTIVEEKNGFGKLKSGAGWIYLDYTKKV